MGSDSSILVPLDGSTLAERAVPVACGLAARAGATVRLAHVHRPLGPDAIHVDSLPLWDDQMRPLRRAHEQAYLEGVQKRLAASVTSTVDLLDGPTAATLAAHAAQVGAELIVMTTHGRGGLERLWLGSVADALVRCSQVALLLRRPGKKGEFPASFRHILVTLDGSPLSEAILPHATRLARLAAAEITLLRVAQPSVGGSWESARKATEDTAHETDEAVADYLHRMAHGLESEGLRVTARVRVDGRAAPAIFAAAREEGADLLALATHGRSGLVRSTLGSVADKLVRASDLPVLVYRPPAPPA